MTHARLQFLQEYNMHTLNPLPQNTQFCVTLPLHELSFSYPPYPHPPQSL